MSKKVQRTCKVCGAEFEVYRSTLRYRPCEFCSTKCRGIAQRKPPALCEMCGAPVNKGRRFCSIECSSAWNSETYTVPGEPDGTCRQCGAPLDGEVENYFCSRDCAFQWKRDRYTAPDGYSPWHPWKIKNRDNFVCVLCTTQIQDRRLLHTHHIDGNKRNGDPHNLVTLCAGCHIGLHHADEEQSLQLQCILTEWTYFVEHAATTGER